MLTVKNLNCIVCNGLALKRRVKKKNRIYYQCKTCGLTQQLPRPSLVIVENIYNGEEKYLFKKNEGMDTEFMRKTQEFYYTFLQRFLKTKEIHVLDFGCGFGAMTGLLKSKGYDNIEALDISEWNTNFVHDKYGVKTHTGFLKDMDFPDGSFDLVIALHVIEHLPDPFLEFREINRILAKGGMFFIGTPNGDSLFAKMSQAKWRYYIPDEHINIFNHKSINFILKKAGFKLLTINDYLYRKTSFIVYVKEIIKPIAIYMIRTVFHRTTLNNFSTSRDGMIIVAKKISNLHTALLT